MTRSFRLLVKGGFLGERSTFWSPAVNRSIVPSGLSAGTSVGWSGLVAFGFGFGIREILAVQKNYGTRVQSASRHPVVLLARAARNCGPRHDLRPSPEAGESLVLGRQRHHPGESRLDSSVSMITGASFDRGVGRPLTLSSIDGSVDSRFGVVSLNVSRSPRRTPGVVSLRR